MQISKYLPNSFIYLKDKEIITYKNTRLKTSYIINIIDLFLTRYQFIKKDTIKLNSRNLKSFYGNNYTRYIQYLTESNFFYLYKNYRVNHNSKTYKICQNIKDNGITAIKLNIQNTLNDKLYIDINKTIDKDIKNKVISDLFKGSFNMEEVSEWLNNNIQDKKIYDINLLSCERINNFDIYYSFDKFGRFHTNYTILKKELRTNFLKINGKNTTELDISNSQPLFLYILMKKYKFKNFDNFDKDVISGKIYNNFATKENISRKEVKKNIYSVLFGRNNKMDKWNKLFSETYPNVYLWIKEYKEKNKTFKSLARKLQQTESDFIFNEVIKEIIYNNRNIPVITIHDSIITTEEHIETVKNIFENKLKQLIKS